MDIEIPRLRIFRHRLRVTHLDPLTRELSIEITLHNDHDEVADEVVLTEDQYRPGLRVVDADDSELSLLPNPVIREILSEAKSQESANLLRMLNAHQAYVYWIVFPEARAIESHGTRVVRLVWTENRQPSYSWGLGLRLFFNVPGYAIEETQ
jgi:hypothetical protein